VGDTGCFGGVLLIQIRLLSVGYVLNNFQEGIKRSGDRCEVVTSTGETLRSTFGLAYT
jgi:hypothetical protein